MAELTCCTQFACALHLYCVSLCVWLNWWRSKYIVNKFLTVPFNVTIIVVVIIIIVIIILIYSFIIIITIIISISKVSSLWSSVLSTPAASSKHVFWNLWFSQKCFSFFQKNVPTAVLVWLCICNYTYRLTLWDCICGAVGLITIAQWSSV